MVVPPAHENASPLFVLCKSFFTRVLFICFGIYLGLPRTLHLDPVASTLSPARVVSTQLYANRADFVRSSSVLKLNFLNHFILLI